MKFALIFLSVFVAISHQQYYRSPRMMFAFPWLAVPQQPAFYYNYYNAMNEEAIYPGSTIDLHSRNGIDDEEGEEFADTQSRINGISRYRPRPSFQDQQNARFLFNLFATTTGTFNNPLLKTATFTSTQTLSLTSVVNCVPAFQVAAVPVNCRRKRNDDNDDLDSITPSETLKLMITSLPSSDDASSSKTSNGELVSSRDEVVINDGKILTAEHNLRGKRFFVNKNQFVVSTVVTTFAFVNSTITRTVNLITPPPAAQCDAAAAATACACLPSGFVVCPPTG
ncbi:uncharacterized protein LOC124205646 [Daphnia pulex]|uniref:uncharacterized protein LOC124205646 n=1 Tax=Daphnia pulex TaxID=6669 RepID=UPI001EDDB4F9|nr:uncharacterized protein LOC124205646 [Daphnia pulex]